MDFTYEVVLNCNQTCLLSPVIAGPFSLPLYGAGPGSQAPVPPSSVQHARLWQPSGANGIRSPGQPASGGQKNGCDHIRKGKGPGNRLLVRL